MTAVDLLLVNNLKSARYVYCSRLQTFICEMKSMHRGSLLNCRPYNTIVLCKCALENDDYANRHRLDIAGSTYTQVLHYGRYFSHKDRGSTYMRINL